MVVDQLVSPGTTASNKDRGNGPDVVVLGSKGTECKCNLVNVDQFPKDGPFSQPKQGEMCTILALARWGRFRIDFIVDIIWSRRTTSFFWRRIRAMNCNLGRTDLDVLSTLQEDALQSRWSDSFTWSIIVDTFVISLLD